MVNTPLNACGRDAARIIYRPKDMSGFSFLEVFISLFLLSLILLGFNLMQVHALRETQNAYFFTVAKQQIQIMAEHLKYLNSNEDFSPLVDFWNQKNQNVLPLGKGYVKESPSFFKISLFWGNQTHSTECDEFGKVTCLGIEVPRKSRVYR